MGMEMGWAVGGVGCAGLGGQTSLSRDAGRGQGERRTGLTAICVLLLYVLCVCSCSAQDVVFSSRHCVELRPYSAIVYLYKGIKTKVSFTRRVGHILQRGLEVTRTLSCAFPSKEFLH